MKKEIQINLSINEIEVLLLMYRPRELQQLGRFADDVKKKLKAARNDLIREFEKQQVLFVPEAPKPEQLTLGE